jgi:dTDP-4-dehydrorhamnose 3,5-epimerase-like enzyme
MSKPKARLRSLPIRKEAKGPRRIIDERGELAILHPEGPVYNPIYFDVNAGPGLYRGGHYHDTKTEYFFVISGACRIRFVDVDTGEDGEIVAGPGDMVIIAPKCAHILEAIQFCRVIEFSEQDVDLLEDTHPYDFK